MALMIISGITSDSLGDGVTREVLDAALQIACSRVSHPDMQTDEGFVQLAVPEFALVEDEDNAFALGVLVTMNLLRSFCAPLPLSPALLQAVIGGAESLNDPTWLQAVLPESWTTLWLFPMSRLAIQEESYLSPADHNRLKTLLYLIDKQNVCVS